MKGDKAVEGLEKLSDFMLFVLGFRKRKFKRINVFWGNIGLRSCYQNGL